MNRQIFIVSIVIIVLLFAGSVVLKMKKGVKQQITPIAQQARILTPTIMPTPTVTIDSLVGTASAIEQIDTSHWKTFTSPNGSFSYQYPSTGTKLGESNIAQPSYIQFSDKQPSEEERKNEVFTNPEIVIAFAGGSTGGSAEYKAYTSPFDHMDEKKITIDAKAAHEDIFSLNGKISGIIVYFDEFAKNPGEDAMSNAYSSKKYGFGLIWIGIYPKNYQKANAYLLLAEKIVSTLKFIK